MRVSPGTKGRRMVFEFSAEPGSQVFVAGTFNNWDPTQSPLKSNSNNSHFKATLRLPPGTHEYKFVVNGVWTADPKCADWVPNAYGSLNSVVEV